MDCVGGVQSDHGNILIIFITLLTRCPGNTRHNTPQYYYTLHTIWHGQHLHHDKLIKHKLELSGTSKEEFSSVLGRIVILERIRIPNSIHFEI